MGLELKSPDTVNSRVLCDSENLLGLKNGLDGAPATIEERILEMFLTLDEEGRREVFRVLKGVLEEG